MGMLFKLISKPRTLLKPTPLILKNIFQMATALLKFNNLNLKSHEQKDRNPTRPKLPHRGYWNRNCLDGSSHRSNHFLQYL